MKPRINADKWGDKIPNTKRQITNKFQASNSKQFVLNFGHWNFEFVWSLEFVIWNLSVSVLCGYVRDYG
jgi:hypothetical protein